MIFSVAEKIKMIMRGIEAAGYSVFLVGGAVRDLLSGRNPKDYDLATDARPEEILALAKQSGWKAVDKLGQNFGVVVVVVDGEAVEVATYRGECYGLDSHRPERVWYGSSLEEDLSRRDFTINAMALDLAGRLYDPFAGKTDLERGLIRTVGPAGRRFAEDALRMFRVCRFVAELGFEPEPEIFEGIAGQLDRVSGLSMERVREEIRLILLSEWPARGLEALISTGLAGAECRIRSISGTRKIAILPELMHLVDMPQNPRFHVFDVWRHTLHTVQEVPPELTLRWAALLHDVAKGLPGIRGVGGDGGPTDYGHDKVSAAMAEEILRRFDLGQPLIKRVVWLVLRHMRVISRLEDDDSAIWHWLRQEARSGDFRSSRQLAEAVTQLGTLCLADLAATGTVNGLEGPRAFAGMLAEMARRMPVSTSDLDYSADAVLLTLGGTERMGAFLKNVLIRVQDGALENSGDVIEAVAKRWMKRQGESGG